MNKKGFTIVEILTVIIILAGIIALAVPIINNSANGTKEKAYQTKISLIENAAVIYAQDHYRTIVSSNNNNIVTYNLTIDDLVSEGLLNTDTDDGKVLDPRTSTSLNACNVEIKINKTNKNIDAQYKGC